MRTCSRRLTGWPAELGDAADRDYARWASSRYGDFAGEISHLKTWLRQRVEWIDSRWQPAPESSATGDRVAPGSMVTIEDGSGTVYYTLDGTDPRGDDGVIRPEALVADGPIQVNLDSALFARRYRSGFGGNNGYVRSGDDWSAPLQITAFQVPASADNLAITEVHFNPAAADVFAGEDNDDNDEFEFLEFQNIGAAAIELEGVQLVEVDVDGDQQGIEFTFATQTLLPGESIVVVENVDAFRSRYGTDVRVARGQDQADDQLGQYSGKLSNGGERITLLDAQGQVIRQFDYDDWYPSTDGAGASLVNVNPSESRAFVLGNRDAWRPSAEKNGTPGVSVRVAGDFDNSGVVDISDIDLLFAGLAMPEPPTSMGPHG